MGKKTTSSREAQLPVQQLTILAICRFAEPVVMTSVYPYLPEMIESLGIPKAEVAKYAGLTSAVFSLSQCFTAVFWGRASDHFGRKPILMSGLLATMTTSILFGMSQTIAFAITVRAVAGACNGNGIIRTMVAEMVPEKVLQPRAFSIMPLVWTIGSILGPSLGGFFTKPAERMPALFGNSRFFAKFPFALPNLIAAVIFFVGISTGILFLKETLDTKRNSPDYGRTIGKRLVRLFKPKTSKQSRHREEYGANSRTPLLSASSSETSENSELLHCEDSAPKVKQDPPSIREVLSRQSSINLLVYSFLALHSVSFDQLLPIFMHLPKQIPDESNTAFPFKFSGGFGLGSDRIGTIFTLYGIFGCLVQFLIFPPVAKRYGVLTCLKTCAIVFPFVYIITPFTALIQDSTTQQAVMIAIMLFKCVAVIFAFPCSTILMTNSALSLRILGTLNGFATSVSAVGRASGPAIGGLTFTWGARNGYIIAPWWVLAFMTVIGTIPIWFLIEMEGFGAVKDDGEVTDDEISMIDEEEGGIFEPMAISIPGNEEEAEEALDTADGPPLSRVHSRNSLGSIPSTPYGSAGRRLSNPIGIMGGETVGPGGARMLSNGLGQTMAYGVGGARSFH